jgi:hypothetical protein
VIDPAALQMVLGVLTGWLDRREREAVAYLIEENRFLRRQLGTRRLRLTDDDRRRLAAREYRVGRTALRVIATTRSKTNASTGSLMGEHHFRRAVAEYVKHDHRERNHQGLDNRLIADTPTIDRTGRVRRRPRLGGLLNLYERVAYRRVG